MRFDWVRRMGVHEAYHLSRANRVIHWICIPIELFGVVKLASLAALGRIDLAIVLIAVVAPVYLAADVLGGVLMTAALAALRLAAPSVTTGSTLADAGLALALFVTPFVFQTQVGHRVFERGIDDTEKNVAELRRTGNPVPILLVFYYHLVELLFALGYRPALRRAVEEHRAEELARITDDPRV